MENLLSSSESNMKQMVEEFVRELLRIWEMIFDTDDCLDNINKLMKCTKNFFDDLVSESLDKKDEVERTIEELKEEAANLQRLLNVKLDLKLYEGTPLVVQQMELNAKLAELRETLRLRREQIFNLLEEQASLCSELGDKPRSLVLDPLPTDDEMNDFRNHLQNLKVEKNKRLHKVSHLRREIKDLLRILDITTLGEREDDLLNDREIKFNNEAINALNEMFNRYQKQASELKESIEDRRAKLTALWDRLSISPNTRKKFDRLTDNNQATYDALSNEVDRCEGLQRQNIKKCVENVRKEIVEWWELCMRSEIERKRFSHFYSDCYTDDLLFLHELELEDLKSFYKKYEKIFKLYEDRRVLWNRMVALEKKESEPGRYNNRGGQLLKEEKERKTITSRLPKIETQLTELVSEYEKTENSKFLIYGEDILDVIASDWEKKQIEKEKLTSARKIPQTPNNGRTPMSFRNGQTSTSTLKRTPSTMSLLSASRSMKRKLPTSVNDGNGAKRSLLHELESPSMFNRPTPKTFKTPLKSPLRKNRVIGTTVRRNSNKRKSAGKKKRSTHQSKNIATESANSSEFENYEVFERHIEPASRSSVMVTSAPSRIPRNQKGMKENVFLPNPRVGLLQSKKNTLEQHSNAKSPSCRSKTPNISMMSRKLTTKNLPILI